MLSGFDGVVCTDKLDGVSVLIVYKSELSYSKITQSVVTKVAADVWIGEECNVIEGQFDKGCFYALLEASQRGTEGSVLHEMFGKKFWGEGVENDGKDSI